MYMYNKWPFHTRRPDLHSSPLCNTQLNCNKLSLACGRQPASPIFGHVQSKWSRGPFFWAVTASAVRVAWGAHYISHFLLLLLYNFFLFGFLEMTGTRHRLFHSMTQRAFLNKIRKNTKNFFFFFLFFKKIFKSFHPLPSAALGKLW